jgi:putative dimethyl sulfoxide reductase chaperone
MIADGDIVSFRRGYYEMLVALFWKEPPGELLRRLSAGIGERAEAARNLHPLLCDGWAAIERFLSDTPPGQWAENAAEEYIELFIGPHSPRINAYESVYLTGRLFDRPLAEIRTILKALGIEKVDDYSEPEDSLAFELEAMRWLVGKQTAAADPDDEKHWLQREADFLREHLLIWAPACAQDIERAKGAHFYRGVALVLRGFLELERALFQQWGLDKVISLEAARQRYGGVPTWKGPTFDGSGGKPGASSSDKKD